MNSIAEKLVKIAENEPKVYEAGRKTEYDAFWDAYQEQGNRTSYTHAFSNRWSDATFKPKHNIKPVGTYSADSMFAQSQITDIAGIMERQNVTFDFSESERFSATFDRTISATLPPIDAKGIKSMSMAFYNAMNLKSLQIDNLREDCTFDRAFNFLYALENIRVTGTIGKSGIDIQNSTKLTHDSFINDQGTGILNVLADKSGTGSTWTITLGSTNLAKLTDGEKAIATQKGWTLA